MDDMNRNLHDYVRRGLNGLGKQGLVIMLVMLGHQAIAISPFNNMTATWTSQGLEITFSDPSSPAEYRTTMFEPFGSPFTFSQASSPLTIPLSDLGTWAECEGKNVRVYGFDGSGNPVSSGFLSNVERPLSGTQRPSVVVSPGDTSNLDAPTILGAVPSGTYLCGQLDEYEYQVSTTDASATLSFTGPNSWDPAPSPPHTLSDAVIRFGTQHQISTRLRYGDSWTSLTDVATITLSPTATYTSATAPRNPGVLVNMVDGTTLRVITYVPTRNASDHKLYYRWTNDDGASWSTPGVASASDPQVGEYDFQITGLTTDDTYIVETWVSTSEAGSGPRVSSTEVYLGTPGKPTVLRVEEYPATLKLALSPTGATATAWEYSLDAGTNWQSASFSGSAPVILTIPGLTDGTEYAVRVRGKLSSLVGSPSDTVLATPGTFAEAISISDVSWTNVLLRSADTEIAVGENGTLGSGTIPSEWHPIITSGSDARIGVVTLLSGDWQFGQKAGDFLFSSSSLTSGFDRWGVQRGTLSTSDMIVKQNQMTVGSSSMSPVQNTEFAGSLIHGRKADRSPYAVFTGSDSSLKLDVSQETALQTGSPNEILVTVTITNTDTTAGDVYYRRVVDLDGTANNTYAIRQQAREGDNLSLVATALSSGAYFDIRTEDPNGMVVGFDASATQYGGHQDFSHTWRLPSTDGVQGLDAAKPFTGGSFTGDALIGVLFSENLEPDESVTFSYRFVLGNAKPFAPGKPRDLEVTATSATFVRPDGGFPDIQGYQYSTDGGSTWSTVLASDATRVREALQNNERVVTITFEEPVTETSTIVVRAVNALASGPDVQAVYESQSLLGAPADVSATSADGSLTVTFAIPKGETVSGLQYRVWPTSQPTPTDGEGWVDAESTESPLTISDLTNGTQYAVQLRFLSDDDPPVVGTPSEPILVVVGAEGGDVTIDDVIDSLEVYAADGVIVATFLTPPSSVTDVEYTLDGGATWISAGGTTSPIVIENLDNGTAYDVSFRFKAADEVLGASTPATRTPEEGKVTPPLDLDVIPGDAGMWIVFDPAIGNVANYQYQVVTDPDGEGDTATWAAFDPPNAEQPIRIDGLTNGEGRQVRLRAVGANGETGPATGWVSVTPSVVTKPVADVDVPAPSDGATEVISEGGEGTLRFGYSMRNRSGGVLNNLWLTPIGVPENATVIAMEPEEGHGRVVKYPSGWFWRGANLADGESAIVYITVRLSNLEGN